MIEQNITLPSKPRVVSEKGFLGVYEIEGLHPGYGHTLGNSLRRITLSSLVGAAITSIKIKGVDHEFSTIKGIKEDVINIILNLKRVRMDVIDDEVYTIKLKVKGPKTVTAKDIETPGQITIVNPTQHVAEITSNVELDIEMKVAKGMGYVARENLTKDKVEIGSIALDAVFTPIRRASYEVENMRVGDRTDFNLLRLFIETDGTITPREALEKSIEIMIMQLKAVIGFKEEEIELPVDEATEVEAPAEESDGETVVVDADVLKTRIETLSLSARTLTALTNANIRTIGGLVRKKEADLLELDGLGGKALDEVKEVLVGLSLSLKE
jgi:DNA-directed RNA polymerase subunit alpha